VHHHFPFIIIPIGAAVIYALREFMLAGHSRWTELAERYANSAAPDTRWRALSFLQMELTEGSTIKRTVYRTRSFQAGLGTWVKERLFPTALVAVSKKGLRLKRQPWHFKHPALLIPWKTVAAFEVMDATKFMTTHAGSSHPVVGAAIQARMPQALSGMIDGLMGDIARFELRSPKIHIFLPADAIDDVTPYLSYPAAAPSGGGEVSAPVSTAAPAQPVATSREPVLTTPSPRRATSITVIKTSKCGASGHPEFALTYDPKNVLERDVRWYAGVLEQMVQSGSRFKAGKTIQLGWSVLRVMSLADGTLGLEEYDLKALPATRQPGVTESLRVLRLQKDTLESVLPSKSLAIPSLAQSCIVCTRLTDSKPFLMQRGAVKDEVSGWFFGCAGSDHDHNAVENLKKVTLYEAIVGHCRAALPFLGFLPGALISVEGEPVFFLNGERLAVRKDSLVNRQSARRVRVVS
jgi:hypothetical protein